MRILVIEDDASLQRLLRRGLSEEGFDVEVAADGECALDLARTDAYDAIVLDLMIPRISGTEVLRTLRAERRGTPILILTARDASEDKIARLDEGADDYLTKPFVFKELVARIRALVRRAHRVERSVIRIGDLELDTDARSAKRGGRSLALRAKEYDLLEFLAMRAGKLVTRAQLHDRLFGKDSETLDSTLEVHVSRLRSAVDQGFAKPLIHTVRGQGYRLEE
jgi:two-component system, OmpR family, copper resistance phosphate regulon response regulator CusR